MKCRTLNKTIILISFALFFHSGWCIDSSNNVDVNSQIIIKSSSYLMDHQLLKRGYSIQNQNDKFIIFYKNKQLNNAEFNSLAQCLAVGKDKAMKLFIFLKDTFKNSKIYLNNELLQQKTNKFGVALIDLHLPKGNYYLKLINDKNKNSINYFFSLDSHIKISCLGTKNFICQKEDY